MAGQSVRRFVAVVLALALLAAACTSDEGAGTSTGDDGAPGADLTAFCGSWQELAELVATDPEPSAETFDGLFGIVDDLEPVVPGELTTDWEAFVGFNRTFRDLLVTVEYDLERVDDDLIARAFGDVETADTQGTASEVAFTSMEDWTASACGDFCARWPELRQALDELGGWLDPQQVDRLVGLQRTLAVGTELAPEGVRIDWELAVATRTDWERWWKAADYDPQPLQVDETEFAETELADLALEILRTADYLALEHLSDFLALDQNDPARAQHWAAVAAWKAGSELPEGWDVGELERWLLGIFRVPPQERHQPIDARLQAWVSQNCEAAGAPGRLQVRLTDGIDDAAGSTLVLSLLRRGGSVADLRDSSRLVGSACAGIGQSPWEPFWRDQEGNIEGYQTWGLSAEQRQAPGLCWHGEPGIFPGGDYTLVAAVFPGDLGAGHFSSSETPPAPRLCLELDVTVAGDTEVSLGAPGPCDATGWPNDLAEDPWRNPPAVDPDAPGAGTLGVLLPSLIAPDELVGSREAGPLMIVAVASGTTLNQIGREQVWPLAAACVQLRPRSQLGDPEEIRRLDRPSSLPLGTVPLVGAPACLDAGWLAQDPPDEHLPLALLAPGAVTILTQISIFSPGEEEEELRCGVAEVVVDGDTVVELPAWEECPT